jgi:hypothetical protein
MAASSPPAPSSRLALEVGPGALLQLEAWRFAPFALRGADAFARRR